MPSHAAGVALKIARIVIGIVLIVFSIAILMVSGFTRASIQYHFPTGPHWATIAIGLVMLICGLSLVRPPAFLRRR